MDLHILLLGGLAVLVAALVQGTLGLGLSLVAAPVVALLDPTLMPGSMLVLGMVMPAMTLAHEWRHVSWHQAGWVPARAIGAVVGVVVLGAVALTAWRLKLRPSRRGLIIAGAVAGVSGTAAA